MGKRNQRPLLYYSEINSLLTDHNGDAILFRRKRTHDLLKLLLEANGAFLSPEELCRRLFGNVPGFYAKDRNYLAQLVNDISTTLALHGAENVFIRTSQGYAMNMEKIAVSGKERNVP